MAAMTQKVQKNATLAAHFHQASKPQNEAKKTGRSFSEELKNEGHASKGGVPHFPSHRAKPQNITTGQAQKLARYAPIIQDCARRYNIPVELICGVILQESGGNPKAVSHAGARGLMQLMPGTAKRFGVTNSFNPAQNIEGGTKYLRFLLDRFNGNVELTLAGYNAGEKNVEKYGNRIPPFRETQNYVPSVLGYALAMIQMLQRPTPTTPLPPGTKLA